MDDEKLLGEGMDGMFNDLITGDSDTDTITYLDENNDIFDLLGMSEDEKKKASEELAKEDAMFASMVEMDSNISLGGSDNGEQSVTSTADALGGEDMAAMAEDTAEVSGGEDMAAMTEETAEVSGGEDMAAMTEEIADALGGEDIASMEQPVNDETLDEQTSAGENEEALLDNMLNDIFSEDASKQEPEALVENQKPEDTPEELSISDDTVQETGLEEDLTKGDSVEEDTESLVQEELSEKELKRQKKKEEKEAKRLKKAEEKAARKSARKGLAEEVMENNETNEANEAIGTDEINETDGLEEDINIESIFSDESDEPDNSGEKLSMKEKLSRLLFGLPDEDDIPTEEELAKIEAKKEKKAQKKEEQAQKKEEKKAEKDLKRSQAKEMAVVKKAAAKDKKAQIAKEEEEEDAKEKKITKKQVISVAIILILLGLTVLLGTNQFNYRMVIKRATNYFEVQKYRMAYEQIVGVDVKNRDQLIRDKIYCVMYVQQQLDSYDNFNKLGMHENALDSLIKGVRKYNEHIEEARELGIEKDLEDLYAQINGELAGRYGVNTDTLNRWISLDRETYSNELRNYVSQLDISVVSN